MFTVGLIHFYLLVLGLGTVDLSQWEDSDGVESTSGKGISKLVIDYGDVEREESILALRVDFVSGPPVFELYIPQVGDGAAMVKGQTASLRSVLRISNLLERLSRDPGPNDGQTSGILEFFDNDGEPLPLNLKGGTKTSSVELSLESRRTLAIETDGTTDPVASGYARFTTDSPVAATAEFRIVTETGEIVTEAGISAVRPMLRSVGPVVSTLQASLDTAIALVNPSKDEDANVRIRITPSEPGVARQVPLYPDAGHHQAVFLRELFPSLPEDFEGTLHISADIPVVATTLRAKEGLPLSSLSLDSLELSSDP